MKQTQLRNALIQTLFLGALIALAGLFVVNARNNLAAQGITAGFSFLDRATGWDVGFSLLPFSIRDPYWWTILIGFLNTLFVGLASLILATVVGLVVATMRIAKDPVLNAVSLAYVEVIRNVPPILQVLAWYAVMATLPPPRQAIEVGGGVFLTARGMFLPALNVSGSALFGVAFAVLVAAALLLRIMFGRRFMLEPAARKRRQAAWVLAGLVAVIAVLLTVFRIHGTPLISVPALEGFNFGGGMTIAPELATMLVATTVYGSAYVAEIVRGGFLSVSPGRIEAGRALGMTSWQIFARVQLPLTIRNIIPMMTNFYVWLVKATTLGIAIGFSDLFMIVASSINQSGQTVELIMILAAGFWLINGAIVMIMSGVAKSLKVKR